jgi:hypothetical protein
VAGILCSVNERRTDRRGEREEQDVGEAAAAEGHSVERSRPLRPVHPPSTVKDGSNPPADFSALAAQLAAALRAVRGYVPHHIWWEAGPAQALLAYQVTEAT